MQKLARRAKYEMIAPHWRRARAPIGAKNDYWKNYLTDLAEI